MFEFLLQADSLFPMFSAFSLHLDDLVIEFFASIDGDQAFVLQFVAQLADLFIIFIS